MAWPYIGKTRRAGTSKHYQTILVLDQFIKLDGLVRVSTTRQSLYWFSLCNFWAYVREYRKKIVLLSDVWRKYHSHKYFSPFFIGKDGAMLLTDGLSKLLRWNESKGPSPPPRVTREGNLTVHPWRNLSETNKPRSDGLGQRGETGSYANTASQSLIILICLPSHRRLILLNS